MDFFKLQKLYPFFNDYGLKTRTSLDQKEIEEKIFNFYFAYRSIPNSQSALTLLRKEHKKFLLKKLQHLSSSNTSLDASRPWLVYWILHALELLDALPSKLGHVVDFLDRCQDKKVGGFGGGPGQNPHLAPTYASVNALMIIGTEKAFKIIQREKLYQFLMKLKRPSGGFNLHIDGESDIRGVYTALSVARLCNLLTPELMSGVPEYLVKCQTYEGGMGGEPGNEAHGGYTFCGLAAATIINCTQLLDLNQMLYWVVMKQLALEGGFQGRTNKLVDSCYSFWQADLFPLLDMAMNNPNSQQESTLSTEGTWVFRQKELQEYILVCCQESDGGLRDKPGKDKDPYHTCYALSGLSVSQHNKDGTTTVIGVPENLLEPTDPIHNIRPSSVKRALAYFSSQPSMN